MRVFITGTDTDVGKTVACAWVMVHTTASYWKPVQAGLDQTDEDTIRALTGADEKRFIKTAYALPEPLSPHEAARRAGVRIEMASLQLPDDDNPLIVEGAGGLMVPLNDKSYIIDLIKQLGLPAILVCRTTLGTINHSLLSLAALRARDIPIAGVILCGPDVPHNREAIATYGGVPIIAHLPPFDPLTREALEAVTPEVDLMAL